MKILNVEFRLIAPLQYYSTQSAGGMRTAPFIGDIALTYSMAHSMGIMNYPPADRFKPNYNEIKDLPFLFTVAVPGHLFHVFGGPLPIFHKRLRDSNSKKKGEVFNFIVIRFESIRRRIIHYAHRMGH